MTLGYKLSGESVYTTEYEWEREDTDDNWWEPVSYSVPPNSTITFEVVTTLGVSFGGTRYHFVVR